MLQECGTNRTLKKSVDEDGNFINTFRYKGLTQEGLQGASDWIVNSSLSYTVNTKNHF